MSNYDDYITGTDKPFAENINDALLLSNVFDLTVPIQAPTMFRDSSWIDTTSRRKCGVAILTLKEALPSGVSVSTVDGQSVLTGTGTVKLGFYPNFNSFGQIKSIDWENVGTVQVNLKTVNNTTIASNISKGVIENQSSDLRTLQEIVIELVFDNATLKSLDVLMENKSQERYGATVGITDVTGLDDRLTAIETFDSNIFDIVYPIGSIYMSVNSTSPSTLFGGTWEQLQDRFLLGASNTYTVGGTGGEATHTLTTNEMPSHTHTQNSHNHTQNAHRHRANNEDTTRKILVADKNVFLTEKRQYTTQTTGTGLYYVEADANTTISEYDYLANTTATNNSTTATNQNTGLGQAHNNMPPYLSVYMWKRTA